MLAGSPERLSMLDPPEYVNGLDCSAPSVSIAIWLREETHLAASHARAPVLFPAQSRRSSGAERDRWLARHYRKSLKADSSVAQG